MQIDGMPVGIEDIIYLMMHAVMEEKTQILETYLPQFIQDVIASKLSPQGITKGVSRFVQTISDLASDAPKLP